MEINRIDRPECHHLAKEGFCAPACIKRWARPQCPAKAVIPLIEVTNEDNLQRFTNHFVHVVPTNRTYYVDSQGRIIITWQGNLYVDNYDAATNPLRARQQTVYDFTNNIAYIYNAYGEYRTIQLTEPEGE